ncbi:hypothetical protein VE03_07098 [Pseudogymnoascus sp. 23342-1-I1]|nr:hypothetical protein VE03_07098 [Pseudogymnoascus sp. 23342-1-I1]
MNALNRGTKKHPPDPQLSSPLLNLPPELRHQIWSEILSGHTIHLEVEKRSLRRIACIDPDPDKCHGPPEAYFRGHRAPRHRDDQEPAAHIHVLPLLLTCKLLYAEAIPYVYSSNTFAIRNASNLLRISSLLPLKHVNAIRSVLLTSAIATGHRHWQPLYVLKEAAELNPDRRQEVWTVAWRILAGMRSLKELHVVLQPVNGSGNFLLWGCREVPLEPVEERWEGEGRVFTLHLPTGRRMWLDSTVARSAVAATDGIYRIDGQDGPVSFDELPEWAKKVFEYKFEY